MAEFYITHWLPWPCCLWFAFVSGCEQLVHAPMHIYRNCLNFLLMDVHGLFNVNVDAPTGSSDRSSLNRSIQLNFYVPNVKLSCKVYLKYTVNWDLGIYMIHISAIAWWDIYHAECPASALFSILTYGSGWLKSPMQDY